MRRLVSTACLFFAWLCANGAIWDVVQVFAWTNMFAGYARELPVQQALRETFDPSKPCELCVTVAKAKQQEQEQIPQQVERSADKLLLAMQVTAPMVFRGPPSEWPEAMSRRAVTRTEPVPVPPPRV